MRQLHQSLRENHHLRHGGRMQYGLFLKGIGLSLEQALQFWRSEFVKGKVDADKVMFHAVGLVIVIEKSEGQLLIPAFVK